MIQSYAGRDEGRKTSDDNVTNYLNVYPPSSHENVLKVCASANTVPEVPNPSGMGRVSTSRNNTLRPRDDSTGMWLDTSLPAAEAFFQRHAFRSPDLHHAVIVPDNPRKSGAEPLKRFVTWAVNGGDRGKLNAVSPTMPWGAVKILKVEVGPDGIPSGQSAQVLRQWLNVPLPIGAEEQDVRVAAKSTYRLVMERVNGRIRAEDARNPHEQIDRFLLSLAKHQEVDDNPKHKSLQEVLLAFFRGAWVRDRDSERVAKEWGDGYVIPEDLLTRDTQRFVGLDPDLLRHGRPVEALAGLMKSERSGRRLNLDRVRVFEEMTPPLNLRPDKVWDLVTIRKDWQRLKRFAANGVNIVRGLGRNEVTGWAERPPLRKKYLEMHSVVNRSLLETWWSKGLAIVLPSEVLLREGVGPQVAETLHFSALHWVAQPAKEEGRPIMDSSNHPTNAKFNLNGLDTRDACRMEFGLLDLPSLRTVCKMIGVERRRVGPEHVSRLVLAKADLKGAFTLLDINPNHASLNAYEMVREVGSETVVMVIILLSGYFGWTGFPFAFGVISRILVFLIGRMVEGGVQMYVDDVIIVTLAEDLNADLDEVVSATEPLLGDGSVSKKKFEAGRVLDVLGWTIDLDTDTVRSSHKNFLKGLYWFRVVGCKVSGITLPESEKVSSYACRYAEVCPLMTPFVGPLYRMQAVLRRGKKYVTGTASREFSRALEVLVATLCLLHFNAEDPWFQISIEDVAGPSLGFDGGTEEGHSGLLVAVTKDGDPLPSGAGCPRYFHIRLGLADVTIQVDGCLTGAGFAVYAGKWLGTRGEVVLGFGCLDYDDVSEFRGGLAGADGKLDSSFQNSSELYSTVFALLYVLVQLGETYPNARVHLVSDSRTVLSWVSSCKWTGKDETVRLSLAIVMATLKRKLAIVEYTHVSSEDNEVADALSRGLSHVTVSELDGWDWHTPGVYGFLSMMHPFAHRADDGLNGPSILALVDRAFEESVPGWNTL